MTPNTKKRHEQILHHAHKLLADVDVTTPYSFRELAKQLAEQTQCHYDTAKRNLAKAARQKRGELMGVWGGKREGSGRPPKI